MNSIALTGRLSGRFVPREALDAHRKSSMLLLLRSHFTGVDRETFDADLLQKNWVILLEDQRGVLRGFSTLLGRLISCHTERREAYAPQRDTSRTTVITRFSHQRLQYFDPMYSGLAVIQKSPVARMGTSIT